MPTVTNYLVSNLPAYVQENRDMLVKNFALAGPGTRERIGIQTGIKGSAYLNYFSLAATMQSGTGCGHNPIDEATLTQRTITTALIKCDGQICPDTLIGKYAEYLVRINAKENDLPFEKYLTDALVAEVNKKIEKLIWQGDHTASSDATIKWIDGFLYQMNADSDVIDVSINSGTSAYNGLLAVYAAMPDETLERGGVIFVSPAIYKAFLQDMVAANFFHFAGPDASAPKEFFLPGTDVKVIETFGLKGSLKVVGTFADNLVYGCDGQNDEEVIDIWWSNDDRVFKYQVKWNSGVAYHFPDQCVLGVFAAAPTMPVIGSVQASLETIATKATTIATNTGTVATNTGTLASADHVYKTKEQA